MGPMQSPPPPPLASRTRVILAVLFGLITVGVVGMHLLSADHQLATPEPAAHHDTSVAVARDDTHQHAAAAETVTDPGPAAGRADPPGRANPPRTVDQSDLIHAAAGQQSAERHSFSRDHQGCRQTMITRGTLQWPCRPTTS
jgi:hypothetical protein